ncbi:MAG: lysozyme inhibitor LprI family protein [Pseudomonadota bacterium]
MTRITAFAIFFVMSLAPSVKADVTFDMIQLYGHALKTCIEEAVPNSDLSECRGKLTDDCQRSEPRGYSTYGISRCNFAESRIWMDVVEQEYELLLVWAASEDARQESDPFAPKNYIPRVDSLEKSQKAWTDFRNNECRIAGRVWGTGTMANVEAGVCRLRLAQERASALRNYGVIPR